MTKVTAPVICYSKTELAELYRCHRKTLRQRIGDELAAEVGWNQSQFLFPAAIKRIFEVLGRPELNLEDLRDILSRRKEAQSKRVA